MTEARDLFPYGIYDTNMFRLVHIGLYDGPDECWEIFLGWPTVGEIDDARKRGLTCLRLTCHYDPEKPA